MYSSRAVCVFILVSVFGLVSCSGNNQPEPEPVQDSWRLSKPVIQTNSDEIALASGLPSGPTWFWLDSPTRPVPADSDLQFGSASESDFKDTTIQFESNCKSDKSPSTSGSTTMKVSGVTRIPVRAFLPKQFWRALDPTALGNAICNISFLARNESGSTHKFHLNGFVITALEKLENLTPANTTGAALLPLQSSALSTLGFEELTWLEAGAELEIVCDRFHNHAVTSTRQLLPELISELAHGPLPSDISQRSTFDPRQTHTRQSCRLSLANPANPALNSGIKEIWVSPRFPIEFSLPAQLISGEIQMLHAHKQRTIQDYPIISLLIKNPSSVPTAYRLTNTAPDSVTLQNVWQELLLARGVTPHTFTATLVPQIDGPTRSWSTDNFSVIELGPGEEARITMRLQSSTVCDFEWAMPLATLKAPQPGASFSSIGFTYKLNDPELLQRYYNWDASNPDFQGETFDVTPFQAASTDNAGVMSGWLPSSDWAEVAGFEVPTLKYIELLPSQRGFMDCHPAGARYPMDINAPGFEY